ncbi:hydroxymethylpyrimidine/phosphomethylpyrimidine kinase [Ruminiclostridium sufflavum DSM 19573]|uniref:Hydroxymethylpyrimidine/phosphomethylpyrimidine kinase n=1 Tax=Ruminiclostridium sufflavum DSM 19573 TaxID=1121337 RepID=A0A318XS50_9FIRM|nr:bifunctional hydroxymethylpyrimidine kinase/phosphomethylpyrimidine kinase [Ruminiclostridium sufflavum]PYG89071.1 hydroxymethylpyrimidine/phosphomethylpyrimidine kinase [Ruminiclostridium sufflavum DSM 19573]
MKTVLTIAGSDCSGGAGIQADIKTITAHKSYAMSAVTALTAQNTTGVYGIMEVPPDFLEKQLECIFSDIYPDAVKIGMVSSRELIEAIASKLISVNAKNIVLDTVMVSTSGCRLMADDAAVALAERLIPIAAIITPNIPEAEVLSGIRITKPEEMITAAERIAANYGGAILIKGGHQLNSANDLLYQKGRAEWFRGERIDNPNTHGTGCTLSAAIASNLAMGCSLPESVYNAKKYISGALKANLNLGKGSGPLDHTFALDRVNFV